MKSGRHLIIDGHNILHAWTDSRLLRGRSMESARARVIAAGLLIHDTEDIRVTVVFDGDGDGVSTEDAARSSDCAVIFSPASMTADDIIEQLVGGTPGPAGQITVATGDRQERSTVEALGAHTISPDNFKAWVERCELRQAGRVSRDSGNKPFGNVIPL
ncbi:MAG: NYN domain-containing protein [Opitutaceae bacterium]